MGTGKNNWGCLLESATERGGFKVRFSVETGTWWFGRGGGVAGKRKKELKLPAVLREREQECGSARE